jgi:Na+/H+ antiporter NhaD/arsenite permease-like protein
MDGKTLSLFWGLPFAGLLLSIALGPLIWPKFWHHHYGKVSLFWTLSVLIPMGLSFGLPVALHEVGHTYGEHFIPFIILLLTLYVLSSGLRIQLVGNPTPGANTLFLAVAAFSSNVVGTVGAAMIFIKPFLKFNQVRHHKTHSVIFFIFLVCNLGGCLTAIGDPPLFIGFLMGVDFFWPLIHLWKPFLGVLVPLLVLYYLIDRWHWKKESDLYSKPFKCSFEGGRHSILLLFALGLIIMSGLWKSSPSVDCLLFHTTLANLLRDGGLLVITGLSYTLEGSVSRQDHGFSWEPMREVAKLFAGIFMTSAPVMAMLKGGQEGPFAPLIKLVTQEDGTPLSWAYFWMTGTLSAFLDNAPTYLIFYNLVGALAPSMMTTYSTTLMAISLGSVFMGALSYIGNAPNFMVKSVAEMHRVPMPSFFGYMAWSCVVLLPLFFLLTLWIF